MQRAAGRRMSRRATLENTIPRERRPGPEGVRAAGRLGVTNGEALGKGGKGIKRRGTRIVWEA